MKKISFRLNPRRNPKISAQIPRSQGWKRDPKILGRIPRIGNAGVDIYIGQGLRYRVHFAANGDRKWMLIIYWAENTFPNKMKQ